MKNSIHNKLISKVTLKIIGNNKERIIKRIKNNNIEILNLKYIKDGILIKIYKKDYEKLLSIKTIYEIEIVNYSGLYHIEENIFNNKYIIISILIGLILLTFLSNLIFSIDIITNDNKMKLKLEEELISNGISKYKLKKNYLELQKIKNNILNKYKDEIEWIEIESLGTKYVVRYEPRIKKKSDNTVIYRDIISSKNCLIKDMYITSGQIVKSKNTYVKKGDIIVSGYIYENGAIKDTVMADGVVYGECWYNITITYPFKYYEEKETGNKNNILVLKIFNKEVEIFNYKKYKYKKIRNKTIIKNNILPIKLYFQTQKELHVINENNNEEQAIEKAIEYSKKKIESNLDENEYVANYKVLNKEVFSNSIELNIFFSVIEDITNYKEINEYEEQLDNKEM